MHGAFAYAYNCCPKASLLNLSSFSSYRDYSFSLYFVKCRRTLLELNYLEGPYPSSEKPIISF